MHTMTGLAPARRTALLTLTTMILAACGGAGGSEGDGDDPSTAHDELEPGTVWPGFITRTVLLNRQEHGRQVTVWREERWENFRISQPASRMTTGFDADWTLTERIRETSGDCVYRREARGTASYPWFLFELDPFNELEYRLYSGGTGEVESVEGTMHGLCRTSSPPEFTASYETMPSWLDAVPFELPDEYQPPGYEAPDPTALGPAIAGRIDPERPNLIRGQVQARMPDDGSRVMLRWNLDRAGKCAEEDARALLRQQTAAMSRALDGAEASAAVQPTALFAAQRSTSGTPLSTATVTGVLQRALGSDHIQVTSGATGQRNDLVKFGVRLSADGQILQSLDTIRRLIETTCIAEGSFDGAKTILAGAVQWTADGKFRVTMRKFDVETGVIFDTISKTDRGGAAGLKAALQNVILDVVAGG
jgi:hypothetical protein